MRRNRAMPHVGIIKINNVNHFVYGWLEEKERVDEIAYKNYGYLFGYIELVLSANIFLYKEDIYLKQRLVIK